MEIIKKIAPVFLIMLTILACKDEAEKVPEPIVLTPEEIAVNKVKDSLYNAYIEEEAAKKTHQEIKEALKKKGYKTFDFVDEKTQDTILMQQYFIAFLKSGAIRGQNEEEALDLQEQHLEYLGKMYEEGHADISGPFGDDTDFRGITIYNVPTKKMAERLANDDPMVKAKRLEVEVHPWWAAKGYHLR
ncbi:YciI family protein [Tamlana sp. 2_MG-2023]|uniref:YciI family protein n=1 Tax=unclassified Tamlana TaxID=2614803 RepID=UPI0026E2F0C2|nr:MULTISPECIES: YciI family protein [unclassified Tamlana]MDO6761107.1 YciI family protein [Tamlana sp. 2_MG-2023]MDO6791560.1 YciI family protein [Tamlana sp. 1_MG-2023]